MTRRGNLSHTCSVYPPPTLQLDILWPASRDLGVHTFECPSFGVSWLPWGRYLFLPIQHLKNIHHGGAVRRIKLGAQESDLFICSCSDMSDEGRIFMSFIDPTCRTSQA